MGNPNIELLFEGVSILFDDNVIVEDFDLSLSQGDRVAIMGSSGCGKSSLLGAVVGLTPLHSGRVEVCGVDIKGGGVDRARREVAWLPQVLNLPYANGLELFEAHFNLRVNSHLKFDRARASQLLDRVGLDNSFLERSWSSLSGGERQRLMIVCAVMLERRVMLLDEPTSALDTHSTSLVADLLASIDNVTMLVVTHNEEFAKRFDSVLRLWEQ